MDVRLRLLLVAFRNRINEPNIEAGFEHFLTVSEAPVEFPEFCQAVATCVHEGLIREPIRLPEGALQCHWHLELTPQGIALARTVADGGATDGPSC